jgi:hypothetical protein
MDSTRAVHLEGNVAAFYTFQCAVSPWLTLLDLTSNGGGFWLTGRKNSFVERGTTSSRRIHLSAHLTVATIGLSYPTEFTLFLLMAWLVHSLRRLASPARGAMGFQKTVGSGVTK